MPDDAPQAPHGPHTDPLARAKTDLIAAAACLEELVETEGPLHDRVAAIWRELLALAKEAGDA